MYVNFCARNRDISIYITSNLFFGKSVFDIPIYTMNIFFKKSIFVVLVFISMPEERLLFWSFSLLTKVRFCDIIIHIIKRKDFLVYVTDIKFSC